jgi:hypothetical protein
MQISNVENDEYEARVSFYRKPKCRSWQESQEWRNVAVYTALMPE